MSNLFTISKSWHDATWLYEQLAYACEGDGILLLQDGVLAMQSKTTLDSFVAKCLAMNIQVFALEDDCEIRGIENQYAEIKLISYGDFVDLTCQFNKQLSW